MPDPFGEPGKEQPGHAAGRRRSLPVRVVRWALIGALVLVVAVVAAVGGGILWLRTSAGGSFVRGQIQERLGAAVNGEVRLGRVEGDILSGIVLHDFALVGEDGVALIEAERIRVAYALAPFFDRRIAIARVELVRPDISLVRHRDGRWNFQTLFEPRPERPQEAPSGWGSFIEIERLVFVDGSVDLGFEEEGWPGFEWSENRFEDLNGELRLGIYSRERTLRRFVANDLGFRSTAPALEVRSLDGEGVWTPDSVQFHQIRLETAGSEVLADGDLVLGEHDSLALEIDAPRIALDEVKRFFPQVRLDGAASLEGRLDGPASSPDLVIETAGVETPSGSSVTAEGVLHDLADLRLDLDARVDPLAPDDARLFVDAYPIVQPVQGGVAIAGPVNRMRIDADLRAPAGAISVQGMLFLGDGPLGYDLTAASRELDLGALIGEPAVDVVLSGAYRIEGRGTGRDAEALFAGELERSRIYRWELLALETRGALAGGVFQADTIVARTPQSTVRGEGVFGLASDGVIQADLAVVSEDPEELWPGLGELGGIVRGEARLEGTYGGFDVDGDIVAGDLSLNGVRADSFAGTIRLDEVGGPLRMGADGTFHALRVGPAVADTARVTLAYEGGTMTIDAFLDHGEEASTDLAAVADFRDPSLALTLSEFQHRTPEATWSIAEGELSYREGGAEARDLTLTENGQTLSVDGVLALDGGASDLVFSADLELSSIARLAGRPAGDFAGRAVVEGRLHGPRQAPVIELAGEVAEGSIYSFRFVRLGGDLTYADRQAAIDLTVTAPSEGHDIVATGTVPVDLALVGGVDRLPDEPVDLHVEGRNTDLTLLAAFIPQLADAAGPIDLRVDVSGTTGSPRFAGQATLRDGRFRIPATGVEYRDIAGSVTFNNDEIVIERIDGSDGEGGSFAVDGRIAMENLRLGGLAIDVRADGLEVVRQARQDVQVNAEVTLTGTTSAPEIAGRVVVDEMVYRLPERSRRDVIDLDEAVVYVELPGTVRGAAAQERSPSLWNRTRLDVEVQVADDAVLTASNARVEIAGDLSLYKPTGIGTPTLSGTLDVLGGFYEEFGKRFTIEEGEIFFYGTPEPNPGLHMVATHTVPDVQTVGDVEIRIIVGGTLRSPAIDLESTPSFDRSEIISIALFGTTSVPTGEQGVFEESVRGLFVGALAAPVQDALARELGLDAIEYAQRTEETGDVAQLFRVGKFITPDVYVTVEQEVGGREDNQAVGLRYQVSRQFMLQASAGTRQSGLDLFWEFAF